MRVNLYFANVDFRSSFGLIISSILFSFFRVIRTSRYYVRKFERLACKEIGVNSTIAVPSNRSGLYAILSALEIENDDDIIVTGFTCSAVIEPIVLLKGNPVYVDIDPWNFCLDPSQVESAITAKTRVIIIQHTYGFCGPINEILKIARENRLFVIEDCALAYGSKRSGKWLGTFGDAAVWSFELSKTVSVGWGGLVCVQNDSEQAHRVRRVVEASGFQGGKLAARRLFQGGMSGLLYHHRTPDIIQKYGIAALFKVGIFMSSAATPASDLRAPHDHQWRFLQRQLLRINEIQSIGKTAQRAYEAVFMSHQIQSASMAQADSEETHLIRFPIMVEDSQRFVDYFQAVGIEVGRWFSSPVSGSETLPIGFKYKEGSCPVAEYVCGHIVNLPLHGRLSLDLIKIIAERLDSYLSTFPDEVEFIRYLKSHIPGC